MSVLAASVSGGGPETVTLVTESLLALAAVVGSIVTPFLLNRRRRQREALAAAAASAVARSDSALSGWTTLNTALQAEINRLQGVTERMQARIDLLTTEMEQLRRLALAAGEGPPDA